MTEIQEPEKTKGCIAKFLGLNTSRNTALGEFCEMKNMSGDNFPLLSTRNDFKKILTLSGDNVADIIQKSTVSGETLYYYIQDNKIYKYGEEPEALKLVDNKTAASVSENSYFIDKDAVILVMPEQLYFNINDNIVHQIKINCDEVNEIYYARDENGDIIYGEIKYDELEKLEKLIDPILAMNNEHASLEFKIVVPKNDKREWGNIDNQYETVRWNENYKDDPAKLDSSKRPKKDTYWLDTNYNVHKYIKSSNSSYLVSDFKVKMWYKPEFYKWNDNTFKSLEKGEKLHIQFKGNTNSFGYFSHRNKTFRFYELSDDEQSKYDEAYPILSNVDFSIPVADIYACLNGTKNFAVDDDVVVDNYVCSKRTVTKEGEEYPINTHIFIFDKNTQLIEKLCKYQLCYYSLIDCADRDYNDDMIENPNIERILNPAQVLISRGINEGLSNFIVDRNRIWATLNENNEIKASKQGSIKEWAQFNNTSDDSYAVSVGTDGPFTASEKCGNYLLFFKENSVTVLYGTRPSNYQTYDEKHFIGVSSENSKSVVTINDAVYYLGVNGKFYRYDTASCECISDNFGDVRFRNAYAVAGNTKYYVTALKFNDDKRYLYCYDTATGLWHQYNQVSGSDRLLQLYDASLMVDNNNNFSVYRLENNIFVNGHDEAPEPFEWSATTTYIGLENEYNIFKSKLGVLFECEDAAELNIAIQYNGRGAFEDIAHFSSEDLGLKFTQMPVRRSQFFKLKFYGKGQVKVYRISWVEEQGSDI